MLCSKCGKDNVKNLVYCEFCKAPLPYSPSEKPALLSTKEYVATMEYAGIVLRGTAFLIDIIILGVLIGISSLIKLILLGVTTIILGQDVLAIIILFGLEWIVFILYFILLEMSPFQATLGKRAMRIMVCDLAGNKITMTRSVIRNVFKNIYILPFILREIIDLLQKSKEYYGFMFWTNIIVIGIYIISFILYYLTPSKRSLHDLIAGTVVIDD